jgi:hypothetical protein
MVACLSIEEERAEHVGKYLKQRPEGAVTPVANALIKHDRA